VFALMLTGAVATFELEKQFTRAEYFAERK
jgi:hypothetical protein